MTYLVIQITSVDTTNLIRRVLSVGKMSGSRWQYNFSKMLIFFLENFVFSLATPPVSLEVKGSLHPFPRKCLPDKPSPRNRICSFFKKGPGRQFSLHNGFSSRQPYFSVRQKGFILFPTVVDTLAVFLRVKI